MHPQFNVFPLHYRSPVTGQTQTVVVGNQGNLRVVNPNQVQTTLRPATSASTSSHHQPIRVSR